MNDFGNMTKQSTTPDARRHCIVIMPISAQHKASTYLPAALYGTGVELDPWKPDRIRFSAYTWFIPPEQVEQFLRMRGMIEQQIEKLVAAKLISHGDC